MTHEQNDPLQENTTGHEWNGIRELKNPVPRAFRIWLWVSILVCVLMWVLYPAWPLIEGYSRGLLGYSSRVAVQQEVRLASAQQAVKFEPFVARDVAALAQDETLSDRFEKSISVLFDDNCAACHGKDLTGQRKFPNLADDHWLWSGSPEEIEYTIQFGINSQHDDSRYAEMPAFGRDELLTKAELDDVIEFILKISSKGHDQEMADRGEVIFSDSCSSCHSEGGVGGLENGAPSLVDEAWIYGSDRHDLKETLWNGRAGVMPHWSGRLTPAEIRQLTMYVIWAGMVDRDK